jgi:hypothetical protein
MINAFLKSATDRLMHDDGCPEGEQIRAGLEAEAPMIRKAAYEEAAKVADGNIGYPVEDYGMGVSDASEGIARAIRALSVKP